MGKIIRKLNVPPENSMISQGFGRVDYCDSYRITKATNDNSERIAMQLFKLPKWVVALLNVRNRIVKLFGLKTGTESEATIFPVIAQNENEILMGVNDKHLNFRVSVLIDREKSYIYTTTLVHYNHNWGKIYFLFVKPFHKIIVRAMVKRLQLSFNFYPSGGKNPIFSCTFVK
jgi:hypothetical protein